MESQTLHTIKDIIDTCAMCRTFSVDLVQLTCKEGHLYCFGCMFQYCKARPLAEICCPQCRQGDGTVIVQRRLSRVAKKIKEYSVTNEDGGENDDEIKEDENDPLEKLTTDNYYEMLPSLHKRFPGSFRDALGSCVIEIEQLALFVHNHGTLVAINSPRITSDHSTERVWCDKFGKRIPRLRRHPSHRMNGNNNNNNNNNHTNNSNADLPTEERINRMTAVIRELSRNVTIRPTRTPPIEVLPSETETDHLSTNIVHRSYQPPPPLNIPPPPEDIRIPDRVLGYGYDIYVCIVTRNTETGHNLTSIVRRSYHSAHTAATNSGPYDHVVIFGIQATAHTGGFHGIGIHPVADTIGAPLLYIRPLPITRIPIRYTLNDYLVQFPEPISEAIRVHVTTLFVQTATGENPLFATTTILSN